MIVSNQPFHTGKANHVPRILRSDQCIVCRDDTGRSSLQREGESYSDRSIAYSEYGSLISTLLPIVHSPLGPSWTAASSCVRSRAARETLDVAGRTSEGVPVDYSSTCGSFAAHAWSYKDFVGHIASGPQYPYAIICRLR